MTSCWNSPPLTYILLTAQTVEYIKPTLIRYRERTGLTDNDFAYENLEDFIKSYFLTWMEKSKKVLHMTSYYKCYTFFFFGFSSKQKIESSGQTIIGQKT